MIFIVEPSINVVIVDDAIQAQEPPTHPIITVKCSANSSFPKAEIVWELEGKRLKDIVGHTDTFPEDNELFNVSSSIEILINEIDALCCVIKHQAFLEPQCHKVNVTTTHRLNSGKR